MIKYFLIVFLGVSLSFCKNSKDGNLKQASETNTKLLVSFNSIGAGVDYAASSAMQTLLEANKNALGDKFTFERVQRGREGEYNICIDLTKLSSKEIKKLKADVEKAINKSPLVIISEGTFCYK